jgi:uncharacterized protein
LVRDVFPFGKPAGHEDVVDREHFIAEVQQRLIDGHSVMLAGPRRIGKSSIAWEILRRLKANDVYVAAVDLFYVTSIEEFATKLMQAILENRTGPFQQAVRALHGLQKYFSRSEFRAKIHDLELGVSLVSERVDPTELLESAIQTADVLARKDGRRMVILLDEFQEIERLGGEDLLKRLRALFQRQDNTSYLFLGSQTTLMQTIFSDRRQAFYRFATLLELPPVPFAAWREYIATRLASFNIEITEPALDLLLERTGGHPYCVMAVAYNAYLHVRLEELNTVNADVIHYAYEQAMSHLASIYDVQWQEIRQFKNADVVLMALVEGIPPYSLPLNNALVAKALTNLQRISVITKGPQRGEYRLVEPMFADWLKRK